MASHSSHQIDHTADDHPHHQVFKSQGHLDGHVEKDNPERSVCDPECLAGKCRLVKICHSLHDCVGGNPATIADFLSDVQDIQNADYALCGPTDWLGNFGFTFRGSFLWRMQEEIEYRADCQHDPQYEIAPASENCHKERPNEPTNAKYSMQNLYPEVLPALVLKQFHRGDIASNIDHTAATSPHKQADSQIDKSQGKRRDHKTKPTHKDRPNKYLMECISLHKHLHQ